jgi:hypothetical protein
MRQIDTGPTDGPPGERLKTAWVTLTGPEAHELLAALQAWAEERAEGGQRSGWHTHITDSEGTELTIAVEPAEHPGR